MVALAVASFRQGRTSESSMNKSLTHSLSLSQCDRTPSGALAKVGFGKGLFGRGLRAQLVNILVVNILVAPRSVDALGLETF